MTPTLSPRQRRIARWSALPVAVIASGIIVSTASYAAFTSTTENDGNSWTAGSIALADDDQGTAMFDASDLQPGSAGERCITVTSAGSLTNTVRLYTQNATTTAALADHLAVTVDHGTGGGFADCTGFVEDGTAFTGSLSDLTEQATDHASGIGQWTVPAGGDERTYRIRYALSEDAPNTAQGGSAAVDLVWEGQTRAS
ncbi:hypothetical protein [Curtobacterium sp. RRHDQ10]|uniref:hypothetical protein n=1 Tax=Curtobacterium phyllosphaerae TaxID=3413379 RepID=UPI003BF37C3D